MKISVRQHLLFWLGYITWDILQAVVSYSTSPSKSFSPELRLAVYATLISVTSKLILFYTLFYFTLKPLITGKKKPYLPVFFAAIALLFTLLMSRAIMLYISLPLIYDIHLKSIRFFNLPGVIFNLFELLIPVCLLIIYELFRYTKSVKEKESKLEREKLKTELNYLKAQINPHFLFNVLSTVHALTRQQAPEAANVVVKLSQLMRFMLFEAKNKQISISEEVKVLEDYIELQQIRFKQKLDIHFTKSIDDEKQKIAPLILLPFVENAFKHGASESRFHSYINIQLTVEKEKLEFVVENSFEPADEAAGTTGIGLVNVKRQLELIYPDHTLKVEKLESIFRMSLTFNLIANEEIVVPDN
jgi:two-component sensor histidine kinase